MKKDIVMRLRKEISKRERPYPVELLPELNEAADEIERLCAERDHARRLHCYAVAATIQGQTAKNVAKNLEWDCFKEEQ